MLIRIERKSLDQYIDRFFGNLQKEIRMLRPPTRKLPLHAVPCLFLPETTLAHAVESRRSLLVNRLTCIYSRSGSWELISSYFSLSPIRSGINLLSGLKILSGTGMVARIVSDSYLVIESESCSLFILRMVFSSAEVSCLLVSVEWVNQLMASFRGSFDT